jgi:anti-sigma factor RsiW
MNCKKCQEEILDALAAGVSQVAPEVAAHQNSCPACAQFFATQQNLFHSIDATLQSLVNQPVPPSFLPTVRARLDENFMAPRSWLLTWHLAGVAALAVLVFLVSYALHRPDSALSPGQIASTTQPWSAVLQVVRDNSTMREPRDAAPVLPVSIPKRHASASVPTSEPEVIVLAEEREAFAKFVAEVPEQPQVVVGLTHPAPDTLDAPI